MLTSNGSVNGGTKIRELDPPPGVVEKTVRKGIEPKSQTEIVFAGDAVIFTETELPGAFGELSHDFNDLLHTQAGLAKVELRNEARKAGQSLCLAILDIDL